jgi:hypothetical protein
MSYGCRPPQPEASCAVEKRRRARPPTMAGRAWLERAFLPLSVRKTAATADVDLLCEANQELPSGTAAGHAVEAGDSPRYPPRDYGDGAGRACRMQTSHVVPVDELPSGSGTPPLRAALASCVSCSLRSRLARRRPLGHSQQAGVLDLPDIPKTQWAAASEVMVPHGRASQVDTRQEVANAISQEKARRVLFDHGRNSQKPASSTYR